MKKILLVISILMGSVIFANETIAIANGEWAPFNGEKLPYYGMCSHMTTDIFALEGIDVKYKFVPWKRAMVLTENTKYDATIEWAKRKEREEQFYYSDKPLLVSKTVMFHRKDYDFDWEKIEDLYNKKIGGTRGYNYGDKMDEGMKKGKIKIDIANSDELNFRKLLHSRFDLFICDLTVGRRLLNEKFIKEQREKITYNDKPLKVDEYYFLVSKKHPRAKEIMEKFNSGMEKIIKSGRYQQYYDDLAEGKYK